MLYHGPIEVGMTFLWEPFLPSGTAHVKVTKVVPENERHEMKVYTRDWVATSKTRGDYTGEEVWNDESRFREAVLYVPPEGRKGRT